MSEPLLPGPFEIYYVIFKSPDVEPILMPLGPMEQGDGRVAIVALPQGTRAPVWAVQKPSEERYTFAVNGRFAVPGDESAVVLGHEEFEWRVVKGVPTPPPMGNNGFIVGVGMQLSPRWEVPEADSALGEIPVRLLNDTGTMLYFKSLWRD